MKRLELNPSDYTTDEIYQSLEFLNSGIVDEYKKLDDLQKMYPIVEKKLEIAALPSSLYFSKEYGFYIRWNKDIKKLEVLHDKQVWHLMSAPRDFRLKTEMFLGDAIRSWSEDMKAYKMEQIESDL